MQAWYIVSEQLKGAYLTCIFFTSSPPPTVVAPASSTSLAISGPLQNASTVRSSSRGNGFGRRDRRVKLSKKRFCKSVIFPFTRQNECYVFNVNFWSYFYFFLTYFWEGWAMSLLGVLSKKPIDLIAECAVTLSWLKQQRAEWNLLASMQNYFCTSVRLLLKMLLLNFVNLSRSN